MEKSTYEMSPSSMLSKGIHMCIVNYLALFFEYSCSGKDLQKDEIGEVFPKDRDGAFTLGVSWEPADEPRNYKGFIVVGEVRYPRNRNGATELFLLGWALARVPHDDVDVDDDMVRLAPEDSERVLSAFERIAKL